MKAFDANYKQTIDVSCCNDVKDYILMQNLTKELTQKLVGSYTELYVMILDYTWTMIAFSS